MGCMGVEEHAGDLIRHVCLPSQPCRWSTPARPSLSLCGVGKVAGLEYTATVPLFLQCDRGGLMRIGLMLPDFKWPGGPGCLGHDLAGVARAADEAGFASIGLMD